MLIFHYGVMGSGKSLELIRQHLIFQSKGIKSLVFNYALDERFGKNQVVSRTKVSIPSIPFDDKTNFIQVVNRETRQSIIKVGIENIFIDEAQFLTEEQVEMLQVLSHENNMNIYCFGLRTNYLGKLFEWSKRLLEIADEIKSLSAVCWCGKPATMNARIIESDKEILIGDDLYSCVCYKHFREKKFK